MLDGPGQRLDLKVPPHGWLVDWQIPFLPLYAQDPQGEELIGFSHTSTV